MNIGEMIRKRREDLRISRAEMASSLNISEDYLKKIENGNREVNLRMLSKIAVYLDVSLEEFMEKE